MGDGGGARRHSACILIHTIQRITVEVDNTTLTEYFIHADLEPGATQWDSTTIAERGAQKILYLDVKRET